MHPGELGKLESLPALPRAAHQIFQVLCDKDAPLSMVADALAADPAVTARVVGAANAAFFVSHQAVYTVEDAAMRLGLNRLRILASSTLLAHCLSPLDCPSFDHQRFWHQAMSVALCASKLVNYVPLETPSRAAYLAALLHGIGILANATVFPRAMDAVLRAYAAPGNRSSLAELEQIHLGFDHLHSGAVLLQRWQLPDPVVDAVAHWREPAQAQLAPRLTGLVRLCRLWYRSRYQQPPDCQLIRLLEPAKIDNIAASCRREDEQLATFVRSMAVA